MGFDNGFFQGFTQYQSSSFDGGQMKRGEAISQQTVINNGQRKTVTMKTTTDKDGKSKTEVTEERTNPETGQIETKRYLEDDKDAKKAEPKGIKAAKKKAGKK